MRIAHVVDFFHTDLPYQEFHLALEHARAGHQVAVITTDRRHGGLPPASDVAAEGDADLADAGVDVVRLPSTDLGHDRVWISGLTAALDAHAPDAVHCHHCFSPTTIQVARWAARRRVALLCDSHLSALNSPGATSGAGRAFYGGWKAAVAPWLRRRVGAFVVNGEPERSFLASHLALAHDRIEIIPLGFDPGCFDFDATRRATARRRWGIAPDEVVVAVTGKLTTDRRSDESLGAAERLAATHPVRVLVAGTVAEGVRAQWAAAAPTLVEAGAVTELGMLPPSELADCFLAADVAVYPFGSTISAYEAAGTGLPVAVIDSDFGRFLATLDVGAHSVDVSTVDLSGLLVGEDERARAARRAADAVGWPGLARTFVDRYEGLAPGTAT